MAVKLEKNSQQNRHCSIMEFKSVMGKQKTQMHEDKELWL